MLTEDEEERALKIALHTELQWQKLQTKIQADQAAKPLKSEESNESFRPSNSTKKFIFSELFSWKTLTFGAVYTVLVVTVTVLFMPYLSLKPTQLSSDGETFFEMFPKSAPTPQDNHCPKGYFLHLKSEVEKEALRLKQQFESSGATVSDRKINSQAYFLEILPSQTPSQALHRLWEKENIQTELLPNCPVRFILIAPER